MQGMVQTAYGFLLHRTDQDEGSQLVALTGGIVRHCVLNLLVGEREVLVLAQLIALQIVGVHQHNRDAGLLVELFAKLIRMIGLISASS